MSPLRWDGGDPPDPDHDGAAPFVVLVLVMALVVIVGQMRRAGWLP